MNKAANIFLVLLLLACLSGSSCSVSRERDLEADFNSFRSWVNTTASQVATLTENDWKNAKADYKVRTSELDSRQEQLQDDLRKEYRELKERFQKLDAEHVEQMILVNWRKELLGNYADMATINEANIVDAYNYFMERVRERHEDWSEQVWDKTDIVFEELNTRKEALKSSLPIETEISIKALQMEYNTLEILETLEETEETE